MPTSEPGQEWWRSAVVYQVYPRSFQDSDGDGVGDLPGLISRLDYLHDLGVDVIWLSPVYRSPHDDNGYDISDYEDIDPTFGTLADIDELIAQLHARGMRLVMDLVVNHTSDEHAWFVDSRTSRRSAHADWYMWHDPRPGAVGGEPGAEPNNWGSFFSGSAWEWEPARQQYFLHLFSKKQPDLNWENPAVRHAVYAMMNRWLDRGVDGFRMDVINFISKDPALPDGAVLPTGFGDGMPFFVSGPRLQEFLAEMKAEVFDPRPGDYLTVGEMPDATVEMAAAAHGCAHRAAQHDLPVRARRARSAGRQVERGATRPARPEEVVRPLAGRARRARLEQPVLEQPRPAPHRLAVGQRPRAPVRVGHRAGHGAAPAPRHPVHLSGRRARA